MKTLIIEHLQKIKKAVPKIESRTKVKINFNRGKHITIKGKEVEEFVTEQMLRAIDFGFDTEDALLLLQKNFILEFIDIKKHTRRKNLKEVRGRVIGTGGKAKKTIESLTGAVLVIHDNTVGVITDDIHLDTITQAITSLIQGAKHGNVFAYLEKQNKERQKFDEEDLGLRKGILKED
jgi:ribosomal RNA assembly protein